MEQFLEMMKFIQEDTIQIPKAVLCQSDITDNAKIMFSVIFTDCLNVVSDTHDLIEQINLLMSQRINNITYEEIKLECRCTNREAKVIKREIIKLLKVVNLSECFLTEEVGK